MERHIIIAKRKLNDHECRSPAKPSQQADKDNVSNAPEASTKPKRGQGCDRSVEWNRQSNGRSTVLTTAQLLKKMVKDNTLRLDGCDILYKLDHNLIHIEPVSYLSEEKQEMVMNWLEESSKYMADRTNQALHDAQCEVTAQQVAFQGEKRRRVGESHTEEKSYAPQGAAFQRSPDTREVHARNV